MYNHISSGCSPTVFFFKNEFFFEVSTIMSSKNINTIELWELFTWGLESNSTKRTVSQEKTALATADPILFLCKHPQYRSLYI